MECSWSCIKDKSYLLIVLCGLLPFDRDVLGFYC